MPSAFFIRAGNDHSVRGTEDYLTARAANPLTGLISPSIYSPPATPTTPRTPGEVLALRGDFSKKPDKDERRPSGAEMLNEHFGLGKKRKGSPLKKPGGGLLSKLDDFRSSISSTSSSRPSTPLAPKSPQSISSRSLTSDAASITSSESNFVVRDVEKKATRSVDDKENSPPTETSAGQHQASDIRVRSGTIMRVAAHWSGIKESLQASSPPPNVEPIIPITPITPVNKSDKKFGNDRLHDMQCLDDDGNQSSASGISPMTKRPPARPQNHKNQIVADTTKKFGVTKKLNQLPSVRLVHPSLAAVPGSDRKAERVVELSDLLSQSENEEVVKVKKSQPTKSSLQQDEAVNTPRPWTESDFPVIHIPQWLTSSTWALFRLLIGTYHVNGAPGSGSLLDGIFALVRLLILAYLVYCVWLVFGLVADVIQAICWPFRIIARFVEWSMKS